MTTTRGLLAIAFAILVCGSTQAQTAPTAVDRQITLLSGSLYQVRDGAQSTVFLVTRDSIVLTDPLSMPTAKWLHAELAARFPNHPVRYVLLTHHHAERASGARVFLKGARVIAQDHFRDALAQARRRDTAAYRAIPMPSVTFSDRETIESGGARIEMIAAGKFHSPDMAVIVFPVQRTVFAADPPPFMTTPFQFGSLAPSHVVDWFEAVARIDFDTIVFGDGTMSTRRVIAPLAEYLSRMRGAVVAEYALGQSLTRLQDKLLLEAYTSLPHYAGRRGQIESIFQSLRYRRVDVTLAGIANYVAEDPPGYCATFDLCAAGGVVPAATVGTTVSLGRRFGFQAEATVSEQFWSARARPRFDEELALRPTRGAVFVRYSPVRNWLSYGLLIGASWTVGDVRGANRVHGGLAPVGGRHLVAANDGRLGVTAGLELSQRIGATRLVFPIRVTHTTGTLPAYWLDRLDVQAGAGLSIPLFRRVEKR